MVEAFELVNWFKMMGRQTFWSSYWFTLILAAAATIIASMIAFPVAYTLAFRVSDTIRRCAIFLLIVPFFTSYLVRIFSWYVVLAEAGPLNAILGNIGLGPFTMLNTTFGTIVGLSLIHI